MAFSHLSTEVKMKTNYATSLIFGFLVLLTFDSGVSQIHNDEPEHFSFDCMMVPIENGKASSEKFLIWKVIGDLSDHPDEGTPYLNISEVSVTSPTKSQSLLGPVSYAYAFVYKSKHINKIGRGAYRAELSNVLFPSLGLDCSIKFNDDLTEILEISVSSAGGDVIFQLDTTTYSRQVYPLRNPSWILKK